MLSVLKNTNTKVKFWFLKNYLSPSMKDILPFYAEKYGFEYQLVEYKWPRWLNQQTEKQRFVYNLATTGFLMPILDQWKGCDVFLISSGTELERLRKLPMYGVKPKEIFRPSYRIIWGYKILFLDVLFPLSVKKIIFVDADQIVSSPIAPRQNVHLTVDKIQEEYHR